MNPEYKKQLEACVRSELDALDELPAPPALANRILTAIERRATAPWYRRAWQTWPLPIQAASLAAMVLLFAIVCFVFPTTEVTAASGEATGWLAKLSVIWTTLTVLADAGLATIQHLGIGFMIGGAVLLVATYFACVGLGTVYVRLAMVRR